VLLTLDQTEVPDWIYGGMTFRSPQVNIIYVDEEDTFDEYYEIIYEQIEDQSSRGGRLVT
jgi:hypothetical protein